MASYKYLGENGALGNQLWQIAGTYGVSIAQEEWPRFPYWAYQEFFSCPEEWFSLNPDHGDDLGSDYLQDVSYWWKWQTSIKSFFAPSWSIADDLDNLYHGTQWESYVGVHVRRGNNTTPQYASHHPPLPIGWYEEAIDTVSGGLSDVSLFVITDDPQWCKSHSIFKDAMFGLGPEPNIPIMDLTKYAPTPSRNAAMDLHAFSRCWNHVISNSTFSWWGAFLANAYEVVYPGRWYGEPLAHIDTSVMFKGLDWKRLEVKDAY